MEFIAIETVNFRNRLDSYLPDWSDSLNRALAMDWDR